MNRHNPLSLDFLASKPDAAARVLQGMDTEQAAHYLESVPARMLAPILHTMETWPAARILDRLSLEQNAAALTPLPYPGASALLRLQDESRRQALLGMLPGLMARSLRRSLAYQLDTVGAWVDMSTPGFRPSLPAGECLALLRQRGQPCGNDIMVVDDTQRIRGIVLLDHLLTATDNRPLASLADQAPATLAAEMSLVMASRSSAWQHHGSLPVRTGNDIYLGTLSRVALHGALMRNPRPQSSPGGEPMALHLVQALATALGGLMKLLAGDADKDIKRGYRDR